MNAHSEQESRQVAKKAVYLDYAATTPAAPSVIKIMTQCLGIEGIFGNPASLAHQFGREAEQAVETARGQLAELINADPAEIVWTSGATEAINLAIKGVAHGRAGRGKHIVTSNLEHKAVLDSCNQLAREGFEVAYVGPDQDGLISPGRIEKAIRNDTILMSLMQVNNEVGTITDIDEIGHIARDKHIVFHVDAAQSCARLPVDVRKTPVDLVSISGHKMYGPKGVGALYASHKVRRSLEPQMHGGNQEAGIRSGTLATHQIAGMGEAARLAKQRLTKDSKAIAALDRELLNRLADIELMTLNGNQTHRVPGIVNVSFAHVESEALMMSLKDVAVSSGSACASSQIQSSHVLRNLSVSEDLASCAIRFSLGRQTNLKKIDFAAKRVRESVVSLRELSPRWQIASNECEVESEVAVL